MKPLISSVVFRKTEILTQDVYLYLFYALNLLQEIIILIFEVSLLWTGLHGINIPLPYALFSVGKVTLINVFVFLLFVLISWIYIVLDTEFWNRFL